MPNTAVDPLPAVVITTWPADRDAGALARTLVTEALAACVNVLPEMQSVYRWQAEVQQDAERQLVIKTTRDRLPALEARLHALHPYEVPEFLVLTVEAGSPAYLAWLRESTRPAGDRT
jgi:periplasmic divalent cation tolerance protein